jgi:hypothetical protein
VIAIFIIFFALAFDFVFLSGSLIDYSNTKKKSRTIRIVRINIDLFTTGHNEAGLLSSRPLVAPVMGVIFDAQTKDLTLEFGDMVDPFHLNIPVEDSNCEKLLFTRQIFIGVFDQQQLVKSMLVPLLYLNDPYGSSFGQSMRQPKPLQALVAFEQFMKRCTFAQALHRSDLGDELTARSILSGVNPRNLTYAPSLLREKQMAPVTGAKPVAVPIQNPSLGGAPTQFTHTIKKSEDEQK